MNIQELRIGNWVDYYGCFRQVHSLQSQQPREDKNFDGKCIIDLDGLLLATEEQIFPIEINRDILIKFGFEDDSYAHFHKKLDSDLYITVKFDDYAHTKLSEFPFEASDFFLPIKAKYVHQLQNLFHALTGEELLYGGSFDMR